MLQIYSTLLQNKTIIPFLNSLSIIESPNKDDPLHNMQDPSSFFPFFFSTYLILFIQHLSCSRSITCLLTDSTCSPIHSLGCSFNPLFSSPLLSLPSPLDPVPATCKPMQVSLGYQCTGAEAEAFN